MMMNSEDDDQTAPESADLIDAVYLYLTESRYAEPECSAQRKRAIRKKAKKFVVRDGVMSFLKKKKGKVSKLNDVFIKIHIRFHL